MTVISFYTDGVVEACDSFSNFDFVPDHAEPHCRMKFKDDEQWFDTDLAEYSRIIVDGIEIYNKEKNNG